MIFEGTGSHMDLMLESYVAVWAVKLRDALDGVTTYAEVTAQVDADRGVPLVGLNVDEHAITQDARVVDDHIEPAEGVDGSFHAACDALWRQERTAE